MKHHLTPNDHGFQKVLLYNVVLIKSMDEYTAWDTLNESFLDK